MLKNKFKFGVKELYSHEFSDGSGVELYDLLREIMIRKLVKWWGGDPLADKMPNISPYNYAINNPMQFYDPDGQFPIVIHVRSFAPYDYFEPLNIAKGDGYHRGFTTSPSAASRLKQESFYETTTQAHSTTYYGSIS